MAAGVLAIAAGVALPGPASTHAVASVALGRGPAAIPGAESAPGAARTSAASPALETPLLRKLALPAGARVTVHVDGGAVTGFAHGPDLAAALAEMGVRVGEADVIRDDGGHFADLLGDLQSGGEFSVARVTHVLRSTELSLPFATREVPDATLTLDTRRTEQEGRPGVREQVHDVTLEDGREVARTLV